MCPYRPAFESAAILNDFAPQCSEAYNKVYINPPV